MDKTTLEQKRQQLSEAHQAWREAVEESKKYPGVKAGDEKTWRSAQKEKVARAKADFETLNNELLSEMQEVREQEELENAKAQFDEEYERFMAEPTNKLNYRPANGNGHGQPQAGPDYRVDINHLAGQARENASRAMESSQRFYRGKLLLTSDVQREKHNKFIEAYVKTGRDGTACMEARQELLACTPKEIHALLTSSDPGFLVPEDFDARVIKDLAGFSVFRRVARIERTGRDVLVFPTITAPSVANSTLGYTSGFAGDWKSQRTSSGGATALTTQNQPTFGQERIQIHRWEPDAVELSVELLEDSAADVMGILSEVIAETRAIDEDVVFTNGDGQGRPLGILNAGITTVNSGAASNLTYSGLLDLYGNLPAQYRQNATWMLESLTYTSILALGDASSHLVFSPNTLPGQLWGRPIAFNEHMPAVGAGNVAILFGDFRFYIIADRMELRVQRLMERMAPNVGVLPFARVGGQCVRTNAFRTQTVSA